MLTNSALALLTLPAIVSAYLSPAPMALRYSSAALCSVGVQRLAAKRRNMALSMQVALPSGLDASDYLAFGLAQCYKMEDGVLSENWLIEPLTGATLECLHKGLPTSYKRAIAVRAGDVLKGSPSEPTGINVDALGQLLADGEPATLCNDIIDRTMAAGRTLRRRVESQVVPVGQVCDSYNFQPAKNKRIVNMKHEVSDDDNVKQDISIDVYGRNKAGHFPGSNAIKMTFPKPMRGFECSDMGRCAD